MVKEAQGDYRTRMLRRGPAMPGKIEKARNPRQALFRLATYFKPFKMALALVLFLVFISTVLGLVGPYLMGRAIDGYIASKDPTGLAAIVVGMLLVFLTGNLVDAASGWIMASVSQNALKLVRRELFNHLQTLRLSFYDANPVGELMSRLTNDIDAINTAISQNVVTLFASVLSLGGILIAMFVLNFWLALA